LGRIRGKPLRAEQIAGLGRIHMGILGKILTFPLMGPINSVNWLAETVLERIEAELYNEDAVRGKLVELELSYDMGEMTEDEFFAAEEELLAQITMIRERRAAQ
jgi:hypothetical protein